MEKTMKKSVINTRVIAANAIIAALYAAWTVAIYPLAYGAIQARTSELMIFLAFYNRKYIPGLVIGCLIANIPSSLGAYDIVFGTLATLIVVIAASKVHNRYLVALIGALVNGVIVGYELHLALGLPFLINAVYVFVGEFFVLAIGAVIFGALEKNETFKKYLSD